MQNHIHTLEQIISSALLTDAAIEAKLPFLGYTGTQDLPDDVLDELSLFGLTLGTLARTDGRRLFGFERGLSEIVQKVFGFDLADARDDGSTDSTLSVRFRLRQSALFGPRICSNLLQMAEISCRIHQKIDELDGYCFQNVLLGNDIDTNLAAIDAEKTDTEISTELDKAALSIEQQLGNCAAEGSYEPLNKFVKQWTSNQ